MSAVAASEAFEHPALFYRTEQEYTRQTVSFLREGMAAGEPMAVAVPGPNLELIQNGLGADADGILFLDMTEAGRNPGRIIPKVLRGFADSHPEGRVRIIGEPIWAGRSAVEYPACAQHEALINAAFEGRAVTILCPYDEARLDAGVLADARVTHPTVISDGLEAASDVYDWQSIVARYNESLPQAPNAAVFSFGADELRAVRYFAVEQAGKLGLTGVRLQDVELAVGELTTNSVVHGGGSGTFAIWAEHGQLVCEVRDGGRLTDPLAGRRPPQPGQFGGRGLILVNYMADLVRVHTGDDGTTIRFYLGL
ncbi:Anti-sigma regulatory factor (Ser/Thr protein kinase) [Nocardia amikacinitolerans]|uniref:anti-sigma factor RsbA family regulatory protein n=1 Tax=Nocardia amikacinitolerans TaxID=756689 RepID=UPI00082E7047|nr:anti-sigma factor RsbA family regulatory protein [Nocardia amikacinitolerans]MCP2318282.1 Anti-sigma regulatory factor (Ser/Thr protein kinase) [Nocardia amikacinitolerans]